MRAFVSSKSSSPERVQSHQARSGHDCYLARASGTKNKLQPTMSQTYIAKIARLTAPRTLVFDEEILDPALMAEDELLAETVVTALSVGTELAAYTGKSPLRPGPVYPRVNGYCNVARVIRAGPKVKKIFEGDLILSFQSHRSAFICKESTVLLRIPENTDPGMAATTYLFNLGYSSLLNTDFKPGCHVAVVGLGVLGMGTVAVAAMSAGRVVAFSNQLENRNTASRLGAELTLTKNDTEGLDQYTVSTGIGGADIAILTSDTWEDWQLSMKVLRKRGVLGVISFPGRNQPTPAFNPLDSQFFYDKQIRILSAASTSALDVSPHEIRFTRKSNCRFLLEMISKGKLPARELITGEHAWHELDDVYRLLENRSDGALSCLLHWKPA